MAFSAVLAPLSEHYLMDFSLLQSLELYLLLEVKRKHFGLVVLFLCTTPPAHPLLIVLFAPLLPPPLLPHPFLPLLLFSFLSMGCDVSGVVDGGESLVLSEFARAVDGV